MASEAQEALANRLRRMHRHRAKWARRTGVTCFRLYDRDIPEYPLVVDWYEGAVVAWVHPRKRDDTPEKEESFAANAVEQVRDGLGVGEADLFVKRRQRQRGLAQYERVAERQVTRVVQEQGLKFEVNLSDYLDTGLFLDHRQTRQIVRESAAGARVLNLFAYTGAFTVYAAAGGARTTRTVDMSNTYQEWTARNLRLNGFEVGRSHRLDAADCLQFLTAGPAAGEAYDIVVCDPPTFSNSKRMQASSFSIDRDYPALLSSIAPWVAPGGVVWFSTNSRSFRLDSACVPPGFTAFETTSKTVPEDFLGADAHKSWRLLRSPTPG